MRKVPLELLSEINLQIRRFGLVLQVEKGEKPGILMRMQCDVYGRLSIAEIINTKSILMSDIQHIRVGKSFSRWYF